MSSSNKLFYSRPYRYSSRVVREESDEYERFMGDFEGERSGAFGSEMALEGSPSTYAAHSVHGQRYDFDLGEPMFEHYTSSLDSPYSGGYEFDASPRNRFVSSPPNLIEYPSLLRSPESVGLRTPSSRDGEEGARFRSQRPLREEVLENEYRRNAPQALPMTRRGSTSSRHSHHSEASGHLGASSRRMSSSSIQSSPSLSSADSVASSLPRTPPPPTSLTLQQQQPLHRMNKEQLLYEEFLLLKNEGMIANQSFDEWLRSMRNNEGETASSSNRRETRKMNERRLTDGEQRASSGVRFA